MKSYLLVGNFGVGNLGDEALKEYFLKTFDDVEWKLVSANAKGGEYCRLPCGIRSLFRPWWKTVGALRKSEGIVFGGGSLFTDAESMHACCIWWWHAFVAYLFRKKIILAFQGIGPFRSHLASRLTAWVIQKSSFVSVRDLRSYYRVKSLSVNTKVVQSFDPVITFVKDRKQHLGSKKVLILIPRKNSGAMFAKRAQELLGHCSWDAVSILSMQPSHTSEARFCEELRKQLACRAEVVPVRTLSELSAIVARGSMVFSARYHGAVVAAALGKEFEVLSQAEGDKLEGLRDVCHHPVADLRARVTEGGKALAIALQ